MYWILDKVDVRGGASVACGKICSSSKRSKARTSSSSSSISANNGSTNNIGKEGNYESGIVTSSSSVFSRSSHQINNNSGRSCASGYVTVLEIGGGETVVASAGKRGELSKSCSRAASLSRRRAHQFHSETEASASAAAAARSSSVPPPASGTVLVRIKTGCDEKSSTLSNSKPFRKQSIKIGSSEAETRSTEPPGSRQPLLLKRSCSANSEIRWQFHQPLFIATIIKIRWFM